MLFQDVMEDKENGDLCSTPISAQRPVPSDLSSSVRSVGTPIRPLTAAYGAARSEYEVGLQTLSLVITFCFLLVLLVCSGLEIFWARDGRGGGITEELEVSHYNWQTDRSARSPLFIVVGSGL